jgi:hypothetical protein
MRMLPDQRGRDSRHPQGSPGNNPIVTSWPGPYLPLPSDVVITTEHNEPLVNWHALRGPQAMAAVAATGGQVHAAADNELLTARTVLARTGWTSTNPERPDSPDYCGRRVPVNSPQPRSWCSPPVRPEQPSSARSGHPGGRITRGRR